MLRSRSLSAILLVASLSIIAVVGKATVRQARATIPPLSPSDISINILRPQPQQIMNEDLRVEVTVDSLYELQTIVAQVETLTTTLVFSQTSTFPPQPGFVGTLSLLSMVRGTKTLTVTATDIFSNSQQAHVDFIYDRKAVLTTSAPDDFTVARPSLAINVACTDDDPSGCQTVTVSSDSCDFQGSILASGQSSISQTLSLLNYDGQSIGLCFRATDSAHQVTQEARRVYVESSPVLMEVDQADGEIWDINPDAMLFFQSGQPTETLALLKRRTRQETIIMADPAQHPQFGFLTSAGAMFVEQSGDVLTSFLYEWRDGALVNLGRPNSASWFKVAGDYAIWNDGTTLFRRNLADGTTIPLANNAGNIDNDVAANGDVVYWTTDYQIVRYRNGVKTTLTNDTELRNTYPTTDGMNVVYRKCHSSNGTCSIAAYTSGGEILLTPIESRLPSPGWDYQLNNGWIAFTKLNAFGQTQVWRRSPLGQEMQLSFFGTSSFVDSLGPNGEVIFLNNNRRYLNIPDRPLFQVGSGLGQSAWLDGQLHRVIGRSAFRVNQYALYLPLVFSNP